MITDDERFIEIQGILAFSDVHPTDCIKINDLIIELSKQNTELKEDNFKLQARSDRFINYRNKLKEWLEEMINEIKTNDIYDRTEYQCTQIATLESTLAKMQEIEGGMNE